MAKTAGVSDMGSAAVFDVSVVITVWQAYMKTRTKLWPLRLKGFVLARSPSSTACPVRPTAAASVRTKPMAILFKPSSVFSRNTVTCVDTGDRACLVAKPFSAGEPSPFDATSRCGRTESSRTTDNYEWCGRSGRLYTTSLPEKYRSYIVLAEIWFVS